jgi:hypothetical protein
LEKSEAAFYIVITTVVYNVYMRRVIIICSALAVLYPALVRVTSLEWSGDTFLGNLFPLFGLLAFTMLWLHIVGAGLEGWLRQYVDFEAFVEKTSFLILILMLLHPMLALVTYDFNLGVLGGEYGVWFVRLGLVGLALLLVYDVGRALKSRAFFIRHWQKVLIVSTIGFFIIFYHSLSIGSDLQTGFLRILWIFYGVTAALSFIYAYFIKGYKGNTSTSV